MNWEEFINRTKRDYIAVGVRMLGNIEDAKDAVQLAYMELFKANYKTVTSGLGYVAVKNNCLNMIKAKSRIPVIFSYNKILNYSPPPAEWLFDLMDNSQNIEKIIIARETLELIKRNLSERDYKIIIMAASGYEHHEIANEVGMAVASMKCKIHRIREKVQKITAL